MKTAAVLQAWKQILRGHRPSLSIEITKECPLRCPGCYAFDDAHLGGEQVLRQLSDFKGPELVRRVLALVDDYQPLHVSLVGGDPLVRYRELEDIIPALEERGIHTQVVTSAFRRIPPEWQRFSKLNVVVSIDGLQPEHDVRRKPATYERILRSISGARITVHCTITGNIASRERYLEQFLAHWSAVPEVSRVWFSLFTPQRGADGPERLTPEQREQVMQELLRLRPLFPKLDMADAVIREIATPAQSPAECIFARTTHTVSADLRTRITPCQFGGDPDCSQCGCIATLGLSAIGHHRVVGRVTAGDLFMMSDVIGKRWRALTSPPPAPAHAEPFPILPGR